MLTPLRMMNPSHSDIRQKAHGLPDYSWPTFHEFLVSTFVRKAISRRIAISSRASITSTFAISAVIRTRDNFLEVGSGVSRTDFKFGVIGGFRLDTSPNSVVGASPRTPSFFMGEAFEMFGSPQT